MKPIAEALKLTTLPEIESEIALRRGLIANMVGTLYPGIVSDEIVQLYDRYGEIEKGGWREKA